MNEWNVCEKREWFHFLMKLMYGQNDLIIDMEKNNGEMDE